MDVNRRVMIRMGRGVVKLFKTPRKARRCYFIWICRVEYEERLFCFRFDRDERDGCMLAEELGLYNCRFILGYLKRSFRFLEA
jgi:hypothetical protein